MKSTNNILNKKSKSLDELKKEALIRLEELEKEKDLNKSIDKYQSLIELNKIIENKFKEKAKDISSKAQDLLKKIYKKKKNEK
jgi:hypothetical protein